MIDRFGSANGRSPAGLQGFVFLRAVLRLFLAGASGGACGRSGTQPAGSTLEAALRDARVAGLRLTEAAGCGGIAKAENSLCTIKFVPELAKRPHERTCGREERAFAGAKLQPAAVPFGTANSSFKIQNSELPIGLQPAESTQVRLRTAGLRRRKLRPARPFQGRNSELQIRGAACEGRHERMRAAGLRRPQAAARTTSPRSSLQQNTSAKTCGCGPQIAPRMIPAAKPARSRADGPVTWRSSPPPGGGCGLPVAARPK